MSNFTRTFTPTLRQNSPVKLTTEQVDTNFSGLAAAANAASRSYTAGSQSAMLSLSPAPNGGDHCWRSDLAAEYIFLGGDSRSIDNWVTAANYVTSVFGRSGAIVAQSGDYTAEQVDFDLGSAYTSGSVGRQLRDVALASLQAWGNNPALTSGLTYAYHGGAAFDGASWSLVAGGAVNLSGSSINYVERTISGTVSTNTTGWTAGRLPMARVSTNNSSITGMDDFRAALVSGMSSSPLPSTAPIADTNGGITERWISSDIRRWWGTLAPVKGSQGSVVVVGDSISEGYGASDPATTSWVSLLRKALFGPDGENCSDAETVVTFFGLNQYGLTYSGSYTQGTAGPTKQSIILQPGAAISFTGTFAFVDVFYTRSASSGSLLFKKDGVTYKTLATSGSSTPDVCSFPSATSASGVSHVYSLEASGAAVEVTGLLRLNLASQRIHITRQALSSQSSSYFSDATTLASITKQGSFFSAPSFYIIALGTNDIYNSSAHNTPAQYELNLRAMCSAIYTANADNRIALVIPAVANESIWTPYQAWGRYSQALRRVAADFGAVVVDLGAIDFVGRGLTADGVHPNDQGHRLLYEKVLSSISTNLGTSDRDQVVTAFSPAFGRTGGSISAAYSSQAGWYSRNRGVATVSARVALSSLTTDPGGTLFVTLPFVAATIDALAVGDYSLAAGSGRQLLAETQPGQARALLRAFDPVAGTPYELGSLTSSSSVTISGTYAVL